MNTPHFDAHRVVDQILSQTEVPSEVKLVRLPQSDKSLLIELLRAKDTPILSIGDACGPG